MARAVFELVGDTTSVIAALNTLPGAARTVARAMRGEFSKVWSGAAADAKKGSAEVRRAYASLAVEERRYTQTVQAAAKVRTNAARTESSAVAAFRKRGTDEAIRDEQRLTSTVERLARRRVESARRGTQATARRERQSGGGGGGDAVGLAERGLTFFQGYGDDLRAAARQRAALSHRAQVLASSELRTPGAQREIMAAVQSTNVRTGIDAADVLSGLERAQASFSALGDSASRATYLTQVLPQLANAAVATGTKLEDMVDATGEYQRQMNISAAELPRAVAGQIAQGRLGSISFKDSARHAGVLLGGGSRFLSTNAENRMRSSSVVGALFQTAGKGGGGGDVSATRARAFLDNFSSDRGRGRLRELIGRNAFNSTGQLRSREGETQSDALARLFEDAFRASGGNASRFGVAVGGVNTRSRALTDQLFRDMQAHGGRATDFRQLVDAGITGSPEDTARASRDAMQTQASRDAQREARLFWSQANQQNDWASENQRTIDDIKTTSPLIGRLLDNSATRGGMDLLGAGRASVQGMGVHGSSAEVRTRRDLFRQQAETEVLGRRNAWQESANPLDWIGGAIATAVGGERMQANADREIQGRTEELVRNAQQHGINVDRPVSLDTDTINALREALTGAVREGMGTMTATVAPQDAAHAARTALQGQPGNPSR